MAQNDLQQLGVFLRKYYRGVRSPLAREMENHVANGEWSLLQEKPLGLPASYSSASEYFDSALCIEVVRKLLLPGDTERRRAAAVRTFYDSEAQCYKTNGYLARFVRGGPYETDDLPILDFIRVWRKEVHRVLGPVPRRTTPKFSGGATLSDSGARVTLPDKLASDPTGYAVPTDFVSNSINGTPFFQKRHKYALVRGNRFFTVDKDSQKDRGCCVEASQSLALQLGIGDEIILRLEKTYGVSFERLPEYHRWLARVASIHGTFATIDLSNASDTVAKALIKLLLPKAWYDVLNSLRAPFTNVDGRMVYLEKFSSMGNGFTFPLETLIFQTLARAIGSNCSSCFGDDIIVEVEHSRAVIAALRRFGFTPNVKKTFCEGPFRESCGGDFFNGQPVRAYYLKKIPCEPQHWVAMANGLRRVDPDLKRFSAAWRYCVDQVPTTWRNFTSEQDIGDQAFYDPKAVPVEHFHPWPHPIRMFGQPVGDYYPSWRVMVPIPRTYNLFQHHPYDVAVVAAAMGCVEEVPLRGQTTGFRPGWLVASH